MSVCYSAVLYVMTLLSDVALDLSLRVYIGLLAGYSFTDGYGGLGFVCFVKQKTAYEVVL